ncbi:GtrA family protein [Dokdonella sp.]|uniref:GtrA family protein n=1 Tax=Dokdonella sp. TaxID=2291710 RepID=UPI003C641FE0
MRQVALFCIGGFLGFLIDAGLVQFLVTRFDANPYASRLLSFVCAATGTWLFNRRFTFHGVRHYGHFGEWSRYLLAMSGGFAVNFTIYSTLVYHHELMQRLPALAVAFGSMGGFLVNFSASRFWIFRQKKP